MSQTSNQSETPDLSNDALSVGNFCARFSEVICDPPQEFNAKGESTRTTRFHFKTKEFILTRFSTLAILPH